MSAAHAQSMALKRPLYYLSTLYGWCAINLGWIRKHLPALGPNLCLPTSSSSVWDVPSESWRIWKRLSLGAGLGFNFRMLCWVSWSYNGFSNREDTLLSSVTSLMEIVTDSGDWRSGLSAPCKPSPSDTCTPGGWQDGGGWRKTSFSLKRAPSPSWIALDVSSLTIFLIVCWKSQDCRSSWIAWKYNSVSFQYFGNADGSLWIGKISVQRLEIGKSWNMFKGLKNTHTRS